MTLFLQENAFVFFPGSGEESREVTAELEKASWVGFGAHADDIEIGIPQVHREGSDNSQLVAVIVTTGAGAIAGEGGFDANKRRLERIEEQKQVAKALGYHAVVFLQYESPAIKQAGNADVLADIQAVLRATKPSVVFVHHPFDHHASHRAVFRYVLDSIHLIKSDDGWVPDQLRGMEVWGRLDELLMLDREQHASTGDSRLPVLQTTLSASEVEAAAATLALFASQVAEVRYDLAIPDRWRERVSMLDSHGSDVDAAGIALMLDLDSLIGTSSSHFGVIVASVADDFRRMWQSWHNC